MIWLDLPQRRDPIRAEQATAYTGSTTWTSVPGCEITMPWGGTASLTARTRRTSQNTTSPLARIVVNRIPVGEEVALNPINTDIEATGAATLTVGDVVELQVIRGGITALIVSGSWLEVTPA